MVEPPLINEGYVLTPKMFIGHSLKDFEPLSYHFDMIEGKRRWENTKRFSGEGMTSVEPY